MGLAIVRTLVEKIVMRWREEQGLRPFQRAIKAGLVVRNSRISLLNTSKLGIARGRWGSVRVEVQGVD